MKRTKLLIICFLTVIYVQSADTAFNNVIKVSSKSEKEKTRVIFHFTHPVTYSIAPDTQQKLIKISFPQSGLKNPSLRKPDIEDGRINKVRLKTGFNSNLIATIYLQDLKTSIYHSLSKNRRELTFTFRDREMLMAIDSGMEGRKRRVARNKERLEYAKKLEAMEKDSGRDIYAKAMVEFQGNKFPEALVSFDKFLKHYPNSVYKEKALFTRAETVYRIAKNDHTRIREAIDAFRVANFSFPNSIYRQRGRLRMGDLFFDMNMMIEASAIYHSILKNNPTGKFVLAALKGRANIYMKKGDYAQAYNALERILLLFPGTKEVRDVRFRIADAFYKDKKYKKALAVYEDSHQKWPTYRSTHSFTLNSFADTYYQLGRYEDAKKLYFDLINLYPKTGFGRNAVNRMSNILLKEDDLNTAVKLLGMQTRDNPRDDSGLESRLLLASLGHSPKKIIDERTSVIVNYNDYFKPEETYNNIISEFEGSKQAKSALFQKAKFLYERKRYINSIVTTKKLIINFPDSKYSKATKRLIQNNLYRIIETLHSQKGYYRLLAVYYSNFDPFLADVKDATIIAKVADAYYELGLYSRALEKYKHSARLDRQGLLKEMLRYKMGKSYNMMEAYKDAEESLYPFTSRWRNSVYAADALHLLGDVYYHQGETKKAIMAFNKALITNPKHLRVSKTAYLLGLIYKEKKNYKKAEINFKRAIRRYRKKVGEPEDGYIAESYYQLVESAYLSGNFSDAIKYSNRVVTLYKNNSQNSWAKYVKSDSEVKLSRDETAIASLKGLAEAEGSSVFGLVATATLENINWKNKNKDLFTH